MTNSENEKFYVSRWIFYTLVACVTLLIISVADCRVRSKLKESKERVMQLYSTESSK